MTPDQKKRLKPLLKKLVMEVKRELKEDDSSYYMKQLNSIKIDPQYAGKVQFYGSDGSGSKTNHIDLNAESIPVIINWLKRLLKQLPKNN